MSATDYTQLTVSQLQAWGTAAIAQLNAGITAARADDTLSPDQLVSAVQGFESQIDAINNANAQLISYAQEAFAQGAGN